MKTALFIFCALLILAGSGCHRERQGTLSGYLLENCDGDPVANETVSFYATKISGARGNKIAEAVTDASGHFSIDYRYTRRRSLIMHVSGLKMRGIPIGTTDLGNLYLDRVSRSVVKVKVNNPYAQSNDEIVVQASYQSTYSMHTPFHDTVFPVLIQHGMGSEGEWRLNQSDKATHSANWSYTNGLLPPGSVEIDVPYCNPVPDTIYITIN
jgi:hypothetical protein